MPRVAVMTDSNSGITQMEGKEMGISVVPMPFTIDDKSYYEDINLTREHFQENLTDAVNIGCAREFTLQLFGSGIFRGSDFLESCNIA